MEGDLRSSASSHFESSTRRAIPPPHKDQRDLVFVVPFWNKQARLLLSNLSPSFWELITCMPVCFKSINIAICGFKHRHMKLMKKVNKPLVSVVIPVYNGVPYLVETVESVFLSTNLPIEVILVDDGSTDGSKAKCRKLSNIYKNLRYVDFKNNQGMTRCLNEGIRVARGEYIARINQDDLMVEGRLEKQVSFLQSHPKYVAVGSYVELFTDKESHFDTIKFPLSDRELKRDWMTLSPFADPSVMYRKDVYLKTTGYSQQMWPADDVQMWYQLGKLGKLANIPEYLTRVRWHAGAGSIRSHKLQMQKTWEVHMWAAKNVRKPSVGEYAFWSMQRMAGLLLPPRLNWFVYRSFRKLWSNRILSQVLWEGWERLNRLWNARNSRVKMVTSQPVIAKRSGV